MNDRFKFRVWLPFEKRMITTDNESFFAFNQHGSLLKINDKNEAFFARIGHTFSKENIMQCTGLKDKNGKLIYEGDIIRDINIPSYFCIVEWIKGGFYLKSTVSNSFLLFDTTQQEIIGNIYENPELLEGEQISYKTKEK